MDLKKTRESLSLNLLLSIFIVGAIPQLLFAFFTINSQVNSFRAIFEDKSISLAETFDVGLDQYSSVNSDQLQNRLLKFIWLNPDITSASVSILEDGELKVAAANNPSMIGSTSTAQNLESFNRDRVISYLSIENGQQTQVAITPIHIGGKTQGTFTTSTYTTPITQFTINEVLQMLLTFTGSLIVTVLALFFLFRYLVTTPINNIIQGAQVISSGNLKFRFTEIPSNELGRLATAFNKMAQDLEYNYKDLEDKVKARTQQLEKTTTDMKKINAAMVNRELKMIELKKELMALRQ